MTIEGLGALLFGMLSDSVKEVSEHTFFKENFIYENEYNVKSMNITNFH